MPNCAQHGGSLSTLFRSSSIYEIKAGNVRRHKAKKTQKTRKPRKNIRLGLTQTSSPLLKFYQVMIQIMESPWNLQQVLAVIYLRRRFPVGMRHWGPLIRAEEGTFGGYTTSYQNISAFLCMSALAERLMQESTIKPQKCVLHQLYAFGH